MNEEPKITFTIIQKCSSTICDHVDITSLAPYLLEDFLLTPDEMYQFTNTDLGPLYRLSNFIQQLLRKDPSSAQKFYNCLLKAKKHSGHTIIVEALKKASLNVEYPVAELSSYRFQALESYKKYLKAHYHKQLPSAEKHPHLFPSHFVNLALVTEDECHFGKDTLTDHSIRGSIDDILRMKKTIYYNEIFKSEVDKEADFVVLEGRPGVGKTTLAQKLCREWADGTNIMLKKYKLVVMVQLRDFSTEDIPSLDDIFYHDNTEVRSDVVSLIGETNGEDVLLILEGWDELPLHLRESVRVSKTKASIFMKLVDRVSLPQATILVTSRHVATKDFHGRLKNRVSRYVEVLGLTSSNIRAYIQKYLQDEAKSSNLIGQLQDRPHIESMCYIPLNCRIVCELFAAQKGELPTTITEIYSQLIRSFLQRHFRDDDFISYGDIPRKNLPTFCAICKLAYEGIINHKLVFSQKEVQNIVGVEFSETFDGFGLFHAVSVFHIHGSTKSFHFNHLTFQEYLAAYHISYSMDHNEQLKLVTEHMNKEQLNNVWKFMQA